MTLLNEVNLLYPNNNVKAISFIEMAFSYVLSNLPNHILKDFLSKVEITNDGVKISFIYDNVIRGKRKCVKVDNCLVELSLDEDSEHYKGEFNPGYYIQNGIMKVIPNVTESQKAYVFTIVLPVIDENTTFDSLNFPKNILNVILLYSSFLISTDDYKNLYDLITNSINLIPEHLDSINNSLNSVEIQKEVFLTSAQLPEIIDVSIGTEDFSLLDDIQDFSYDLSYNSFESILDIYDLNHEISESVKDDFIKSILHTDFAEEITTNDLNLSSIINDIKIDLSDIPSPAIEINVIKDDFTLEFDDKPIDNTNEVSEYIEKSSETLGSINEAIVPNATFWLKDEDPEMVASATAIASSHLATAKTALEKNVSAYSVYNSHVTSEYNKFKAKVDKYIAELDAEIKKIQAEVQVYQAKIQQYSSKSNSNLQTVQASLQVSNDNLQKEIAKKNFLLNSFKTNLESELASKNFDLNSFKINLEKELGIANFNLNQYKINLDKELSISNFDLNKFKINFDKHINIFQSSLMMFKENVGKKLQVAQINVGIFKQNLDKKISEINLKIQKYQLELQLYIQQYQIDISLYSAKIQENIQISSVEINKIQIKSSQIQSILSEIQFKISQYSALINISQSLYQRYVTEFNLLNSNNQIKNDSREFNGNSRER